MYEVGDFQIGQTYVCSETNKLDKSINYGEIKASVSSRKNTSEYEPLSFCSWNWTLLIGKFVILFSCKSVQTIRTVFLHYEINIPFLYFLCVFFQEYAKVCNDVVWATSMFQRNLTSLSPTLYDSLAVHCLITSSCHVWGQNFYHKLHANSLLYCNHKHIYDWVNFCIESNLKWLTLWWLKESTPILVFI